MNRFFRSALFPLIIIVLLVYLASQTLLPGRSAQQKITYSQLISKVKEGAVNDADFNPNRQQITANLVEGGKVKVNYPTSQSATQFQNLLEDEQHQVRLQGHGLVGVVGAAHQRPARS